MSANGSGLIDQKLETLLAVYKAGSFTAAAQILCLTQPAVSQHIKQLESDLGATVFIRGEGGLKLTPEGEIAVKYANRMKILARNLRQSIADEKTHVARIAVGITHTAESNLLVEILARYSQQNAQTRITIISDSINNLYTKLKTYEIDLAIIEGKISDTNFNSILLDTDSLLLAVSAENPLAKKSMVTLEELKKERLILRLPDSATRNLFVSHLESNGASLDEFNVALEVGNVATIKALIKRNFGVSVLAKSTFVSERKKGRLIGLPIENLSMIREINVIYHKDFEHPSILHDLTRLYYNMAGASRG